VEDMPVDVTVKTAEETVVEQILDVTEPGKLSLETTEPPSSVTATSSADVTGVVLHSVANDT